MNDPLFYNIKHSWKSNKFQSFVPYLYNPYCYWYSIIQKTDLNQKNMQYFKVLKNNKENNEESYEESNEENSTA